MPDQIRVAIIMAGGSGERFWPLSREAHPKQLLALTHPRRTMLEETVRLVEPIIPLERIFVVTSTRLVNVTKQGRGSVPEENIVAEPARRNTCGCLVFAAAHLMSKFDVPPEKITMAVVTTDHMIGDAEIYRSTLESAMTVIEREPALGVVGIKPDRPETGYGYIELPAYPRPVTGSSDEIPTYMIARFREKPNREMAEELLQTGRCYWNSGMFFWRLSVFMDEMEHANPSIAKSIKQMAEALRNGDSVGVEEVFINLPSLPIDIALLEKARNVVMTRGDFPWEDVGSWDALGRTHPLDDSGNVIVGDPVVIDSRDNIIYNATKDRPTDLAVVGVEGVAIVVTDDAILVVQKDKAQEVKRAVAELKSRGAKSL